MTAADFDPAEAGAEVKLSPHDIVIQNGTRHAWRNKSDRPAKLAFVESR